MFAYFSNITHIPLGREHLPFLFTQSHDLQCIPLFQLWFKHLFPNYHKRLCWGSTLEGMIKFNHLIHMLFHINFFENNSLCSKFMTISFKTQFNFKQQKSKTYKLKNDIIDGNNHIVSLYFHEKIVLRYSD
jgi:hypothetical protein